jgi:hypothetical protein
MGDYASNGLIQSYRARGPALQPPLTTSDAAAAFSVLNFWILYLMHPFVRQKLNRLK